MRISLVLLILSLSCSVFAARGGFGAGGAHPNAGVHNNGTFNNNNVYNNHGYNGPRDGYNHDNWYGDGIIDDNAPEVVVGYPDDGYEEPSCQTVQTCTSDGVCVSQQNCN